MGRGFHPAKDGHSFIQSLNGLSREALVSLSPVVRTCLSLRSKQVKPSAALVRISFCYASRI